MMEAVVPAVLNGKHGHDDLPAYSLQNYHILTKVAYTSTAYLCILHYGRLLGVDKRLSYPCLSPCLFDPLLAICPPSFERFPPPGHAVAHCRWSSRHRVH